MPTVSALASGMMTRAPGLPRLIVPGAATPVLTMYLLEPSAAKVTTSPASTVPVPVIRATFVPPTAVAPEVT
ncbi:hypothetical protein FQZ97_1077800 [compost metagenome]